MGVNVVVAKSDLRRHENARSRINKVIGGLDGLMDRRRHRRRTAAWEGLVFFLSSRGWTILYCVCNARYHAESTRLLDGDMTPFLCESSTQPVSLSRAVRIGPVAVSKRNSLELLKIMQNNGGHCTKLRNPKLTKPTGH